MTFKKGSVHISAFLILLIIGFWVGVFYFLISKNIIKVPFKLPFLQKEPQVELKTEYKNPFDKKTQFVNPFDQTKNPFATAK